MSIIRIEQRARLMLLASLPVSLKAEVLANRATSAAEVLFRIFTETLGSGQFCWIRGRQHNFEHGSFSAASGAQDLHARCHLAGRGAGEVRCGDCQSFAADILQAECCEGRTEDDVALVVESVMQFADVVL